VAADCPTALQTLRRDMAISLPGCERGEPILRGDDGFRMPTAAEWEALVGRGLRLGLPVAAPTTLPPEPRRRDERGEERMAQTRQDGRGVLWRAGDVGEWLDPGDGVGPERPRLTLSWGAIRSWIGGVHPIPPGLDPPDPRRMALLRTKSAWAARLLDVGDD
jgi:hypothetical protein